MVLYPNSCICLEFCIKGVSTSNSNPGLVMTRGVNFWNLMSWKSGPDNKQHKQAHPDYAPNDNHSLGTTVSIL